MFSYLLRCADEIRHRRRKRSWSPLLATGRRGEDLAHRYLRQNGYTVVARNYRTRSGTAEIDLIAWDKDALVFIEVKTRHTDACGAPDRAVDREKRDHMFRGAREYSRRAGVEWEKVRFDVVNVVLDAKPSVRHSRDVFPLIR